MPSSQPPEISSRKAADLENQFRAFVAARAFPCVGAKSALGRHRLDMLVAQDISASWDDGRIYKKLALFSKRLRADPRPFQSFAVIFAHRGGLTEPAFEAALWARLQSLSDRDAALPNAYDCRVSQDPDSPHFSLSFGGEAYFVVGLHPGASRPARRFATAVLVFNPHDQFEQLRASGQYDSLRRRILARDLCYAGSANPMLSHFGDISEARQYSGRAVGEYWSCPLIPRVKAGGDAA